MNEIEGPKIDFNRNTELKSRVIIGKNNKPIVVSINEPKLNRNHFKSTSDFLEYIS